jgi:5-methylcytosine-specific restriction protein A
VTLGTCLDCGEPSDRSRCPGCHATRQREVDATRGGATARGYTRAWERQAAAVKRQQPACDVCGSTADLTVDHVVAKARGGTDDRGNLRTLCRRHNSAKGSR